MAKEGKKIKEGRPTKLTPELVARALEYLAENDRLGANALLPTIERLSLILDVHRDTIYEWAKVNPEFSDIVKRLMSSQADKLLQNGLAGRWNASITKLVLSKHGYVEKTEVDQNLSGDVSFVNAVPRPKRDGEASTST